MVELFGNSAVLAVVVIVVVVGCATGYFKSRSGRAVVPAAPAQGDGVSWAEPEAGGPGCAALRGNVERLNEAVSAYQATSTRFKATIKNLSSDDPGSITQSERGQVGAAAREMAIRLRAMAAAAGRISDDAERFWANGSDIGAELRDAAREAVAAAAVYVEGAEGSAKYFEKVAAWHNGRGLPYGKPSHPGAGAAPLYERLDVLWRLAGC
ncbi:MAG: hypothetical protein ACRC20_09080 [Segniliparus sp.]|uniref:hypothetical protein n=1 Tax=Segniliparus sp. TaxID=2804064 RepID=UPI003F3D3D21